MDKIYRLSDTSDDRGICENLKVTLEKLRDIELENLAYITILSHVVLLESGFIPQSPIDVQWNPEVDSIKLLYLFPSQDLSQNQCIIEKQPVFTLFVSKLGSLIQIIVKGNFVDPTIPHHQDESSSLYFCNITPYEFLNYSHGTSHVKLQNMPAFSMRLRNSVILPLINQVRILRHTYPGVESMEILPNEIVTRIVEYVNKARSVLNMEMTCKRFQALLSGQQCIWKALFAKDFSFTFADMSLETKESSETNWRQEYQDEFVQYSPSGLRLSSFFPFPLSPLGSYPSSSPSNPFSPRYDPPFTPDID
ncbi:unnamed protein product [Lepeophtheirus salmonis]|uniref:(salmon louse) hypothetical protein n=1 Tax=Lepeophtheirus salmonis TaxID=72036 RepID=A0A7R8D064_LEPSM|nr:unnamed protein product [Lepeophtheirus salmonis]CAF2980824.1 unnamed protein product [Lepeophtheirus salmonis]